MEIRKSEKADLQNKRLLFTEIGCIVALALVYFCFEFTTGKIRTTSLEDTNVIMEVEDLIPITFDTPPPPPAAPKIPVLSDVIDIIEDDIIVDDKFISIEDNPTEGIVLYDYIEVIEEEVEEADIPFMLVEQKPLFNGGDANAFSKWVNQRLVYPETCKENGISGRVVLSFTIRKDGTLADAKVVRGVHPDIDREALRVINSSPKWTPGKQRDRAVAVSYNFPVIFMLR
ncbi:MAG: energy transducer TonB [Bacteroidales bacterium]|nr:energy transducer TonB [Bacteroidales bacterium]